MDTQSEVTKLVSLLLEKRKTGEYNNAQQEVIIDDIRKLGVSSVIPLLDLLTQTPKLYVIKDTYEQGEAHKKIDYLCNVVLDVVETFREQAVLMLQDQVLNGDTQHSEWAKWLLKEL